MIDRIAFYLAFGMRALIFLGVALAIGTFIFMKFIPDTYVLYHGAVNLQPAKNTLFMGYLLLISITSLQIWFRDYQRQYIPNWLR